MTFSRWNDEMISLFLQPWHIVWSFEDNTLQGYIFNIKEHLSIFTSPAHCVINVLCLIASLLQWCDSAVRGSVYTVLWVWTYGAESQWCKFNVRDRLSVMVASRSGGWLRWLSGFHPCSISPRARNMDGKTWQPTSSLPVVCSTDSHTLNHPLSNHHQLYARTKQCVYAGRVCLGSEMSVS